MTNSVLQEDESFDTLAEKGGLELGRLMKEKSA